jgi:vitellogenic carboxypeptidase-like protein
MHSNCYRLQGGPGSSSLFGLFAEMGPYSLVPDGNVFRAERKEVTWNDKYGMLFIDNPVGAGFSFTDSDAGYCNDTKTCVSNNLYSLLQQFYGVFPDQMAAPLYITGESYAGHYIPGIAALIHRKNEAPTL